MTGSLLPEFVFRAIDANGLAMPGALLQFYLTGTTTPAAVYTGSSLATPLSNPVVADSGGLFAPIYPDPTKTYRAILKTSAGVTIQDIDPVIAPPSIPNGTVTSAMLAAGVAAANLGYTPLSDSGDTANGELILGYTLAAAPDPNSAGFRGAPPITKNANYTFSFDDPGRLYRHTDSTAYAWTIPPNSGVAFPVGTIIPCRNFGSGLITLTRGSGVSLRIAGAATDQNVALAQYSYGAITKEDTDLWIWSGTGGS